MHFNTLYLLTAQYTCWVNEARSRVGIVYITFTVAGQNLPHITSLSWTQLTISMRKSIFYLFPSLFGLP